MSSSNLSFKNFIESNKLKIIIKKSDGVELIMNVTMSIVRKFPKSGFNVGVEFCIGGTKIGITHLDNVNLMELVECYREQIAQLAKNAQSSSNFVELDNNSKPMMTKLKDATKIIANAKDLFQDLRVWNIYTEDECKNVLVRTTIELDGDVITIIRPDLLSMKLKSTLLYLHNCNVFLANCFFAYKINKFFSSFKDVMYLTRISSAFIGSAWSLVNLFNSLPALSNDLFSAQNQLVIALQMIYFTIPLLLYKFLPKIIGHIIWHEITKVVKSA